MAGIFYDPSVHAWGDALVTGYQQGQDSKIKNLQTKGLYNQLQQEEAVRTGMAGIDMSGPEKYSQMRDVYMKAGDTKGALQIENMLKVEQQTKRLEQQLKTQEGVQAFETFSKLKRAFGKKEIPQELTNVLGEIFPSFKTVDLNKLTPVNDGDFSVVTYDIDGTNSAVIYSDPATGDKKVQFIKGTGTEPKDELNRQIDRWNKLKKEGKENTYEGKAISSRISKLTDKGGMSFEVLPDGTVRVMQGSLGDALPATQKFTQTSQLDRFNTVIDVVDKTINNIEESPTRAGVIGSVRSIAQKVAGVAGDVSPDILAGTMKRSLNALPGLTDQQRKELSGYFDPAIPENEIYENTMALELAKLRVTSGGGGIRAIDRAFKDAKKDVAITGMFSSNEAIARLKKVREEFVTERDKQQKRLAGDKSGANSGKNVNNRIPVKTGTFNGRKVIMYSDGGVEYAD